MSSRGSMSLICQISKSRGGTAHLKAVDPEVGSNSLHEKQVQYFSDQERNQLSFPLQLTGAPQVSGVIFIFFLIQ